MGSPEHIRSSMKVDVDEDVEVNIDSLRDDDYWDHDDNRKHRSSKSRTSRTGEEGDELDGRKKNITDRHESRKRTTGSSRTESDQDVYEARKDSRSKQMKKKVEENASGEGFDWYQDGETENRYQSGGKHGSRVQGRAEESERKKLNVKHTDNDLNVDKVVDGDARYLERRDSGKERGHGSSEHGRNSRRRWDEADAAVITDEYTENSDVRSSKSSYSKNEMRNEPSDSKTRGVLDRGDGTDTKFQDREVKRVDPERSKRGRSEAPEEDFKGSFNRDERPSKERFEEHRQLKTSSSREFVEIHERPSIADEDGNMWTKEKRREIESFNRSSTPERSARRHCESDNLDMDYDRTSSFKRKEQVKDGSWDDKSKGRDYNWGERNRDRENFKDNWKRRQEKELKEPELTYDQGREWELPRRGRERMDGERPHGRSGGRKDGSRTEAVKTSSKYGISNENYDVIEIQTKPFDYGKEESRSAFPKSGDVSQQPDTKLAQNGEGFAYSREERSKSAPGSRPPGEDSKDRTAYDGMQDQTSWRDGLKSVVSNRGASGQGYVSGSQPPPANQDSGLFNRSASQGIKGSRMGRGGRIRPTGRENQQGGLPMPLMGSPFAPLAMPPPGPMQSLAPNMSPAPGPPISPGVFIPPFQPPVVWPGPRGVDMNMLPVPPGLPPVPPGLAGPRFSPNIGNPQNSALFFNPSGPGRPMPPNMSSTNFDAFAPNVRGQLQEKAPGGWVPSRTNIPHGKAPSRGEQNDYSQNFVDTGMRPQNYIRELELTSVVEDYPKLRELIQKKDEIVAKSASAPMYYKCDLKEQVLSPEFFGTKFDVILVDPPWEEYVHRAPGVTDRMEYWTFEEIMDLKIEAIADTPSFIFLWVGDGVGLEQGRQCLKKWGFRRCEDICWVKTNKSNAAPGLRHDAHTLFQRSKEHCLMGIKGTVRRSTDGHIIHANIDTDVIIAEEPPYGSTAKPEDMYRIVEHFALGRRRLELFGEDHNIRSGWLTVGKGLTSSNFNSEAYIKNFADKDGKVWQGGGGRNPPPEAPHLVLTTPDIEALRPKSPMKNQQQLQHQHSSSISLTTANSSNKRNTGNSPQNHGTANLNQEASSSNISNPGPWAETFKGRDGSHFPPDERIFGHYDYNAPFGPVSGEFFDFESHRGMNMS